MNEGTKIRVSQSLSAVNSSCKIERSYHANYPGTCSFHLDQTFYWAAIREKEAGALALLLNNQLDPDVSTSTSKSHMIEVPSVRGRTYVSKHRQCPRRTKDARCGCRRQRVSSEDRRLGAGGMHMYVWYRRRGYNMMKLYTLQTYRYR